MERTELETRRCQTCGHNELVEVEYDTTRRADGTTLDMPLSGKCRQGHAVDVHA